jgi:nitrile hydratase subunit beta
LTDRAQRPSFDADKLGRQPAARKGKLVNGVHDLGGMHGFGPVLREENEPVFHSNWERRVLGITFALAANDRFGRNNDQFRHAIERMEPARYLSTSYYEHWLHAVETLLVEKGLLTRDELAAAGIKVGTQPARGADRSGVSRSTKERRPRFKPGDRIVTRNLNPVGHTRLPRYARGKPGVIARDLGAFTFPDTNAHGAGRNRQHAYSVRFDARDLWGRQGKRERVFADFWEDYLEPAPERPRISRRGRKR